MTTGLVASGQWELWFAVLSFPFSKQIMYILYNRSSRYLAGLAEGRMENGKWKNGKGSLRSEHQNKGLDSRTGKSVEAKPCGRACQRGLGKWGLEGLSQRAGVHCGAVQLNSPRLRPQKATNSHTS